MRRARHILMCWEFGGGNGHARRLKLLGGHLTTLGYKVSYALRRPEVGAAVGIAGEALRGHGHGRHQRRRPASHDQD
jgi:hypothetical protein